MESIYLSLSQSGKGFILSNATNVALSYILYLHDPANWLFAGFYKGTKKDIREKIGQNMEEMNMENTAINFDKFVNALLVAPEIEDEIIALYSKADLLETMIAQRKIPNYYKPTVQVYQCIHAQNLEGKLIAVAKQTIGVISKAQRETGFRILTRYLATDTEKVEALKEMCDFFNRTAASFDEYVYYEA